MYRERRVPRPRRGFPMTHIQSVSSEVEPQWTNKTPALGHVNSRFSVHSRMNLDVHADKIVAKMEQDDALMENTPVSEQMRKEALRDLPQTLTVKRCVKTKLSKSVSQKSRHRPISAWKSFKYRTIITFKKFVGHLKNFNYFELWAGTLKDVEGRFGSGYASYFKFLRWLLVLNFLIAIPSFTFLVLPQIMYDVDVSNSTNNATFAAKDIFLGDLALEILEDVPPLCENYDNTNYIYMIFWLHTYYLLKLVNRLNGGFFLDTVLHYGHYTNETIELITNLTFDMQAAYFALMVVLYLISFLAIAVSSAESYRRSYVESEGGLQNVFASKIFCGWDCAIATKEAAALKSSAIYNELKELLSESLTSDTKRSCLYKFWTVTIQIVVNIFVLVILVGAGWVTWELLDNNKTPLAAIVANLIIMIFPVIFNYIANYEDYKNPKTVFYITLTRTFLLGCVIVGVVVTYWLKESPGNSNCWEDGLGSEIYRMIIFDFAFSVVGATVLDLLLTTAQCMLGRDHKSEFNIAKHTLQIIYNQSLFWVGFFYSPILPIVVTLKMFIIWYVREWSVRKLCKPPKRTWRAAQAQTWFMIMIFFTILIIIAMHGYALTSITKSNDCGPFRNYRYIYEVVTSNLDNLEENMVWSVILNVTKPGGVALIMIALGILVYFMREQALAKQDKVKVLREMLVWVAKDKKVLVQWYNDAIKGNIDFSSLPDTRYVDPNLIPRDVVSADYTTISDRPSSTSHFTPKAPRQSGIGSSRVVPQENLHLRFKTYN